MCSILVPVALKAASISTSVTYSLSKGHDVVMLHCNPIMEGIRDPSTIMVDVKWWVLEDNEDKTSTKSSDDETNKSRKKILLWLNKMKQLFVISLCFRKITKISNTSLKNVLNSMMSWYNREILFRPKTNNLKKKRKNTQRMNFIGNNI